MTSLFYLKRHHATFREKQHVEQAAARSEKSIVPGTKDRNETWRRDRTGAEKRKEREEEIYNPALYPALLTVPH